MVKHHHLRPVDRQHQVDTDQTHIVDPDPAVEVDARLIDLSATQQWLLPAGQGQLAMELQKRYK